MHLSSLRLRFVAILLPLAVLATVNLTSRNCLADAPLEGTKPAQWRLVWTESPATEAALIWSTKEAGDKHVLKFRRRGTEEFETVEARSGAYEPDELFWHAAKLSGLKAETEYDVQMVSDGEESPVFYFATAPERDRAFTILFGGDSRSSSKDRRAVNRMIASLVERSLADDNLANDILALAHGGDYIVSGSSLPQWTQWMTDHELTVTSDGRLLPVIPARGNHDRGDLFNPVFGFPADDENQYMLTISGQLALITLNTNESTSGDQAAWLKERLKEARPKHRWLLAQYHRPAFPAVKTPGGALRDWVPLFEEFNVDLVCEADGHCIKRTVPIRDGKHDPTGVVYIGEGGLGVGQRSPKKDRWYLQSPGMADKGHHVQALTFGDDLLRYQCIRLGGEIIDRYQLEPREK